MSEQREFIAAGEARPPFFAGVDLGGTSIKIGIVDDLGRPLSWVNVPTEIEQGPEEACRRMLGGGGRHQGWGDRAFVRGSRGAWIT